MSIEKWTYGTWCGGKTSKYYTFLLPLLGALRGKKCGPCVGPCVSGLGNTELHPGSLNGGEVPGSSTHRSSLTASEWSPVLSVNLQDCQYWCQPHPDFFPSPMILTAAALEAVTWPPSPHLSAILPAYFIQTPKTTDTPRESVWGHPIQHIRVYSP